MAEFEKAGEELAGPTEQHGLNITSLDPLPPRYPDNVLEGYRNGCLLDLRVRYAMELLKTSARYGQFPAAPAEAAEDALDIAAALFDIAEKRGLIEPLPSDDRLPVELKLQAARTGAFAAEQQIQGGLRMQSAQGAVAVPFAPGAAPPRPGGRH